MQSRQDTLEKYEYFDLVLKYYDTLIRLHCASNAFEKAGSALERATKFATTWDAPLGVMRRIEVFKANLALKQGDLDLAVQCARAIGQDIKDNVGYDVELELTALARIHMAQNAFAPAMDLLERMLELAESQNRINSMIALEILGAKACFLKGDEKQAMARLKRALTAARPGGYVRTFVDEGLPIQALLQMLLDHGDRRTWPQKLSEYIEKLLRHFEPTDISTPTESKPSQKKWDKNHLTRREQQVIELIAQGLAYDEVADRLGVSVNTVRFHIKNIYSKLNVNSRFMAVERVHQKGLL